MLNHRTYITAGVVAIIVIIAGVGAFFLFPSTPAKQQIAIGDPADIVHDFYDAWLKAAHSTTTDPYRAGLAKSPLLSPALRTQIAAAQKSKDTIDPVLCQDSAPVTLDTRVVYSGADQAQFVLTASHSNSTKQAIVKLLPLDGGWYIDDIQCSLGEFAPTKEFSFDTDGSLLKSDVKPLDGKHWYIIFAQDGEQGHYAPLLFSAQSMCAAPGGTTTVCAPDTFTQASKAHVQGAMTETGVDVKKIQFLQ